MAAPGANRLEQILTDALPNPNTAMLGASQLLWNPSTQTWERQRTPTTTKFVTTSSPTVGDTTVWTPTTGKRFRVMACQLIVSGNAARAAASTTTYKLTDGAGGTVIWGWAPFLPAAAGTTQGNDFNSGLVTLPGNGYLSTVSNTVLMLNNGATLTSGSVTISVIGTEE